MNVQIERSSLSAWPALREEQYDNWMLRFAGGQTRRSNSVNVMGPSTLPLGEKICHCERAFADAGIRLVFKCAEVPHIKRLEPRLALLGYESEGETNVMTRRLSLPLDPLFQPVTLRDDLTAEWLETALRFGGVAESQYGNMEAILRAIRLPHVFGAGWANGRIAAIGLAIADRDKVGFFDIVTVPEFRRQGFARSVMAGMMSWAGNVGGRTGYLQVVEGNEAAQALYRGLGFAHRYKYWYRGRPRS